MRYRTAIGTAAAVVLAVTLGSCAGSTSVPSGMSFSADPLLGKVVWNDLITEDLDAAREFYGGLFGWTFESAEGPSGAPYLLARSGDVYVGGLVGAESRSDGTRISRWLPYVSVADVDEAVSRGVTGGAEVAASPRDVRLGRVAAIIDPEGAVIGLARSNIGDPDDRTTAAGPGRVVWTEMLANDPDAQATFYGSVVGYEPREIQRRGGTYTMLVSGGQQRAGILEKPVDEWQPVWLTYFGVTDPAAAARRAEALGGTVIAAPSPGLREGTMAVVTDPSGAILVLQQIS